MATLQSAKQYSLAAANLSGPTFGCIVTNGDPGRGYPRAMRPGAPALVLFTALASVWAACGAKPPQSASRALAGTGAVASSAVDREARDATPPVHEKVAANARCEGCHADVASEWRASLHAASWDDPVFLSAYAIEPLEFCRACHAPEAPALETSSPARHLGVGCITCHVPAGRDEERAHVTFTRQRSDGEGCASCHQFEFPEPQEAAMQSTFEEHAASPERERACGTCHMPQRDAASSHVDHRFRVQGDAALLRSALAVEARRDDARVALVSLRTQNAGHAVPTGDMFRRLEVRATAGEGEEAIHATPVVLARELVQVMTDHGLRKIQIGDHRVPADGQSRDARLVFPRSVDGLPIRWEVVYQRMGPREAALFGVDLDRETVVVAEGVLPTETSRRISRTEQTHISAGSAHSTP